MKYSIQLQICKLLFSFSPGPDTVLGILVIGSTTNLSVSWSPASGQVASYAVLLYRDKHLDDSRNLGKSTFSTLFLNRKPGVQYCVVVVTRTEGQESNSLEVCNATCELQMHLGSKHVHMAQAIQGF